MSFEMQQLFNSAMHGHFTEIKLIPDPLLPPRMYSCITLRPRGRDSQLPDCNNLCTGKQIVCLIVVMFLIYTCCIV